jgi:hypothetical protein
VNSQKEQRLKELRAELESGQKVLAELQNKETNIKDALTRIAGAIKILEEELSNEKIQKNSFC